MSDEKRRDPIDGVAYTFDEIQAFYTGTYKKGAIKAYWEEECVPVRAKKGAAKGGAKAKAKTEVKPKAKVKAKAKAKSAKEGEAAEAEVKEEGNKKKAPPKENQNKFVDMEASGLCVCGEALIDFFAVLTQEGASAYRGVPGGSPFNCCIAAQRLDIPVTFLGALSTDMFGEELFGHLTREGVNMELAPRVDKPTTLAFVSRSKDAGEKYAFFKENAADRSLTRAVVAKGMGSRRFKAVHLSLGAVTLEHDQCNQAFWTFLRLGNAQGALRSFDPNIRSNMIKESHTKYSQRVERFLRLVDLVKTSEEDMEFLYGEGADLASKCSEWLKLGPKLVVVTRGAKGAEAFVRQGDEGSPTSVTTAPPGERPNTISEEGKPAPVVDTVGAGDTFMAGLIAGCLGTGAASTPLLPQLLEGKPWDEAATELLRGVLTRAGICAAITCSRQGANPPTAAEVTGAVEQLSK